MTPARQSRRVDILASTLGTGGAERVIEALARRLPALGYPVRILCIYGPGEVGRELAQAGISVRHGLAHVPRDPGVLPRLVRLLGGEGRGILLCADHHDAVFAGALAARLAGVKHRIMMVHSTGLWGRRSSFALSDRIVMPLYGRIVALAQTHARYLIEHEGIGGGKIRVVGNGIDAARFRPVTEAQRSHIRDGLGISPGSFVVVIVAALRPEKNHELFLAAASRVAELRRGSVFLVVGDGAEAEKLQRIARDLSRAGVVRFMGRRDDVAEILAAADASVLCSHPVVETFPIAVLEAMACGVPVVATDVGAVREMLVDGSEGFIVAPGDVTALVGGLAALAGDAAMGRRVGAKARERVVRDFTVERMVGAYAALFEEMRAAGGE